MELLPDVPHTLHGQARAAVLDARSQVEKILGAIDADEGVNPERYLLLRGNLFLLFLSVTRLALRMQSAEERWPLAARQKILERIKELHARDQPLSHPDCRADLYRLLELHESYGLNSKRMAAHLQYVCASLESTRQRIDLLLERSRDRTAAAAEAEAAASLLRNEIDLFVHSLEEGRPGDDFEDGDAGAGVPARPVAGPPAGSAHAPFPDDDDDGGYLPRRV
ncbi:MAG: hypothetical protein LC772_08100 [Chloroflexi bacterium]|nr:hypothetical protein [Chloroflexota bacterium]